MRKKITKKQLVEAIESYFKVCEGEYAIDEETGTPIPAKNGGYIYEKLPKSPTITGLALALGMVSRQELLQKQNDGSSDALLLKRAISQVEENAERRLLESGVGGAKFFLASNFEGWNKDADEESLSNDLLSGMSTVAIKKYLEKLA